jgi:hypothetical protein
MNKSGKLTKIFPIGFTKGLTWGLIFSISFKLSIEPLAQLVEHLTFNQMVVGSIPTRLTTPVPIV